jgi:membrane-associated phospholipid phosphatase
MTETKLKILIVAALVVIDAAWIVLRGFSFDATSLTMGIFVTIATAALGYFYRQYRSDMRLATIATETSFLIAFSAAAAMFSYLITTLNLPLIDKTLIRTDALLGFHWSQYVSYGFAHRWINLPAAVLYQSTLFQIALAVVVLPALGHTDRSSELVSIVMVSALFCVVIAGILPSAGALAFYHPGAAFFGHTHTVVDLAYKQTFFDLRDGALKRLSLRDVHGLVAFPSYHVALCGVMVVAFRGMRRFFWPILLLNTLVMLSTPLEGGHHLSDGLGGAALAFLSAAIVIPLRARLRPSVAAQVNRQEEFGEAAQQHA